MQALKQGYGYPQYAWLVYDWYPDEWWESETDRPDCTNDDLKKFLERALVIGLPEFNNETTDIGTVSCTIPRKVNTKVSFSMYVMLNVTTHLDFKLQLHIKISKVFNN